MNQEKGLFLIGQIIGTKEASADVRPVVINGTMVV